MLLNFDNVRNEKLTAITLQIDQFDARGNPLGVVNVAYDDFEFEKGKFVSEERAVRFFGSWLLSVKGWYVLMSRDAKVAAL